MEVRGRLVVLGQHPRSRTPRRWARRWATGRRPCCGACGLDLDLAAPLAEAGRSLSSGQRRRLALARVLGEASADPAGTVVLLDEPTAHLDAASEQAVVAELRALAGAGALVLAVAHRDALRHAADRVVDLAPAPDLVAANAPFAASMRANDTFAPIEGAPADDANGEFVRLEAANRPFAATTRRGGMSRAIALGTGAALAGVALTASAAWLIARAADQPPILTLSIAVVAVRGFAIARPLLRHLERVAAHADGLGGWCAGAGTSSRRSPSACPARSPAVGATCSPGSPTTSTCASTASCAGCCRSPSRPSPCPCSSARRR